MEVVIIYNLSLICFHLQALEKSKYEQSLESVRRFIAMAEKELELYYRHIALYGDPNDRNCLSILDGPTEVIQESQSEISSEDDVLSDLDTEVKE